jgi:hypothetical protein
LTGVLTLTCPSCGTHYRVEAQPVGLRCPQCQVEHVVKNSGNRIVLALLEGELDLMPKGAAQQVCLNAIKKLNLEILDLQAELDSLSKQGSPLDTVRLIGFCAITLGLVFSVLFGQSNLEALSLAAVGIVLGIVLHGSTELFGQSYYIRKTYLKKLIYQKQVSVFQYERFFFLNK